MTSCVDAAIRDEKRGVWPQGGGALDDEALKELNERRCSYSCVLFPLTDSFLR